MPLWGGPCPRDIKSPCAHVVGRFVYHHHLLSHLSIYYSIDFRRQTIVYIVVISILIAPYLRSINTSSSTPNPPHNPKMPIQLRPPPGTPGAAWPAIVVGLFVAFGGVLFGYDTGTIGGILAMPYWLKTFSTGHTVEGLPAITSSQSSMIVSILSAGTFFGALTAAPTADFFGRRYGLMVTMVVFCLGVILQTIATAIPMFTAGRFFAGKSIV